MEILGFWGLFLALFISITLLLLLIFYCVWGNVQPERGRRGREGCPGPRGEPGCRGPCGPQGVRGGIGLRGLQGYYGIQGLQGRLGVQGYQGSGAQGDFGPQGLQGTQGTQGAVGSQGGGFQGPQGNAGIQGLQGSGTGPQGSQGGGGQGPMGSQGFQGPIGTGDIGPQGLQGEGFQGPTGPSANLELLIYEQALTPQALLEDTENIVIFDVALVNNSSSVVYLDNGNFLVNEDGSYLVTFGSRWAPGVTVGIATSIGIDSSAQRFGVNSGAGIATGSFNYTPGSNSSATIPVSAGNSLQMYVIPPIAGLSTSILPAYRSTCSIMRVN